MIASLTQSLLGSPPRMRGKVKNALLDCSQGGITPAYAGKSKLADFDEDSGKGSPPRMRGKGGEAYLEKVGDGITPACAGKSPGSFSCRSGPRDHPRVCGEKRESWPTSTTAPGSPPRMRGKAAGNQQPGRGLGITPAYAGKSARPLHKLGSVWDHPRVCGEKQVLVNTSHFLVGITPAYAGKRWCQ